MPGYAIERHRILGGSSNPLSVSIHNVTTLRGLKRLEVPNRVGEYVVLWATRETGLALGYSSPNDHPADPDAPTLNVKLKIKAPGK